MLDVQFPAANFLRFQGRVCSITQVAGIETFIVVRCAERPAVVCLDFCVLRWGKGQTYSWTQCFSIFSVPIAAKTHHEGHVPANGILVLKIQCRNPGGTMV